MTRAALLGACVLACAGCGVRRTITLNAHLTPLAGQSDAQKQVDLDACMTRSVAYADAVVTQAANRAVVGALLDAAAGAATGAAVGAAVGNGLAGYGAKVGTASWGTQAALGGAFAQPDWYTLVYYGVADCLVRSGYGIEALERIQ